MKILNVLEKKFGYYVPANITYYLIGGQILLYILTYTNPQYEALFPLQGNLLLQGQWFRIITFLFIPLSLNPLFFALSAYVSYLIGTALERKWGSFYYFFYVLISYSAIILLAFLFPKDVLTNTYLYTSLFLAFAYLYPEVRFYIFFIIPVKVKWVAWLTWIGISIAFVWGSLPTKVLTIVSISNFLLFFGKEIAQTMQLRLWHVSQNNTLLVKQKAYLKCVTCSATEKDKKTFYYCNTCVVDSYYCDDHIHKHKHASN